MFYCWIYLQMFFSLNVGTKQWSLQGHLRLNGSCKHVWPQGQTDSQKVISPTQSMVWLGIKGCRHYWLAPSTISILGRLHDKHSGWGSKALTGWCFMHPLLSRPCNFIQLQQLLDRDRAIWESQTYICNYVSEPLISYKLNCTKKSLIIKKLKRFLKKFPLIFCNLEIISTNRYDLV